ncbi:MAG: phosphoribosylformylglycinamidine synthase subunit PurQ [Halanaerobiales bacterium]
MNKKARFAVVTFPGSNCDLDCYHAVSDIMNSPTEMLWYKDQFSAEDYDCVILPGGFSYGDYLRSGAIARFSPVMESVIEFAAQGGLILGICNGFQILLEAGLLPGAMKVNNSLKFICRYTDLEVVNKNTPFTNQTEAGEKLSIPVAHGEGNYYIDQAGLEKLKENNQIVLRYLDDKENPNGSLDNIAGICNQDKNIFGLMPHPERCVEALLGRGTTDGRKIFSSIISAVEKRRDIYVS